jgi:hypothetical protein
MNPRARFIETVLFGKPDRIPLEPGHPRESTLAAWREQGLPAGMNWEEYVMGEAGVAYERVAALPEAGVVLKMLPSFEEKVLSRGDGHLVVQDWMGAVVEISEHYDHTYLREAKDFVTRRWHSFPVQSRQDWEQKMRWRYDPDDPARFPDDFAVRCQLLHHREQVLQLTISGPFWQMREWCGFEGLCTMMVDDPTFVDEMAYYWQVFVLRLLERLIAHVAPDYVLISEDMAYKSHSMISPAMARRFLMPAWQAWIGLLRGSGCRVIGMDCDGYVAELLPLWIEAGFNYTWPLEVAAGNDILAYRRRYGRQMAFGGGIDKRALAAGSSLIRREVQRVAPLIEAGGYVPGCDHAVPADVPLADFVEYTRLLARLTGWA